MILLNGIGIIIVAISMGIIALLVQMFGSNAIDGAPVWVVVATVSLIIDIPYRLLFLKPKYSKGQAGYGSKFNISNHWVSGMGGGSLMLLPAWLFGILTFSLILIFS